MLSRLHGAVMSARRHIFSSSSTCSSMKEGVKKSMKEGGEGVKKSMKEGGEGVKKSMKEGGEGVKLSALMGGEGVKLSALKSMEELQGPSFLTTLYWLFGKRYFNTTQQMQIEHKKIYGPLWKSTYGPLVVVNVASAQLIEEVLRQEGPLPVRTDMPHWRAYRELRHQAHGPLSEMGIKWHRIRSILNPRLLKPHHVGSYSGRINQVVQDLVVRLRWLRTTSGDGVMVHQVTQELYKFAFEGICSVVFESRMGCLEQKVPEETQKFIWSVGEMFRLSPIIVLFPRSMWPYLPYWNTFVSVWDHLFLVSEELVQKKMEELEQQHQEDVDLEGAYLTHLLLSQQMSMSEILGSVTELLLAGVDTTSNTISWALYHLAREPAIQERLHQEVLRICPAHRMPDGEDVAKMPYLKAVVRETLRMYPVVPGNARLTVDGDIVVGGHLFPKGTLFHLCHYAVSMDESVFPDPHAFLPERWLRGGEEKAKPHPFGSVPFGFGVRACLGRRVAELEMYLLLVTLIKEFEVRPDPAGTVVTPITRTLLCPATPINLLFVDR
ncbi:sterol 26-hydroxylase, mitochondrial isoform X2 [Entelurus aequoreus]|uniref:sterol 26-hydroxylase, mitochondrial isoform X2 n=1 Tax=Entelurus aequoreus TaxID=161455 RepID=UPI002B1E31A9|nr:sterol 26-hydroxylase, mitochondrial isoform X2 [Entelurus aequoreus]